MSMVVKAMAPSEAAVGPGRLSGSGVVGILKKTLQAALRAFHLTFLRRPIPRRIALYMHEIDANAAQALDELFPFFQEHGYEFVNAETYDAALDPTRRMAFLSFDDNYVSWYEHRPLFAKYRVRATFYVNSLPLDRDYADPVVKDYYRRLESPSDQRPLTSRQLAALVEDGHTVGCHSHSHFNLAALDSTTLTNEVLLNRSIIEAAARTPVRDFSFPFGMPRNLSIAAENEVRRAGFTRIAHATPGMQYVRPKPGTIHRGLWHSTRSLARNVAELCVDGGLFVRVSGRSPVG
jgi:peptidoglycan/xylan/chitin deacetylase (PgdA/CDA1 family)